jgi:putative lipoic acid-binding regulatory protein
MDRENKRPEIEYPTKWDYKIIGPDIDEMIKAVESIVNDLVYDLSASNISKKANYFSLNLTVEVSSETVRDLIFQKLSAHAAIKFVI